MMSLEETPPDAWLGINEAIYYEFCDGKENTIVSSVAKINESYLREASDSQKQYVVLHTFALPHRYEEGSCLIIATTHKNHIRFLLKHQQISMGTSIPIEIEGAI